MAGDSLHNILLVVLDDWGNDAWGGGVGRDLPHTPTLDALARSGVVFRKMWVNPVCCSSRAELLTGRYSFRTGIGRILDKRDPDEFELEPEEFTLPELFKAGLGDRYGLAAFGKWHLSRDPQSPNQQGFDHYSGCLWNLRDYRDCALTTNGVTRRSTVYATTQTANDAIAWIHANQAESFFVYLSFHAPHVPIHVPPQGLHHQGVLTDSKGANERRSWKAAIEGVDTELGRLLDSLPRARMSGSL